MATIAKRKSQKCQICERKSATIAKRKFQNYQISQNNEQKFVRFEIIRCLESILDAELGGV